MAQIITVRSVDAGYRNRVVLQDINITVAPGQFVGLVAPNGAGKSTLLKTIAGVLPPLNGEILLHGRPLSDFGRREIARQIAVVGPDAGLFDYTVEQMVFMGRFAHIGRLAGPNATDWAIVQEALAGVNMEAKRHHQFSRLSQGEQQKVVIARALAQTPQLMLLDEPTAHLDIANQYAILHLIRSLAEARHLAVIAVVHDLNLALRFSTQIILLHTGRILACGAPSETVTVDRLRTLYGLDFTLECEAGVLYARPHIPDFTV